MVGGTKFTPDSDIPDLSGKVIFITGGNSGLGKECALQLSKHSPTAIYITSRSEKNGQAAVAEIQAIVPTAALHVLTLDLASLDSIQDAVKRFLVSSSRLDILINNAGIMAVPAGVTKDGYEIQFGTNHLGHALITKLLLPTLLKTAQLPNADVRIVTLTSDSHSWTTKGGIKFESLQSSQEGESKLAKYGQSKLANLLQSQELARRYPSIKSVAVHPGTVETGLSKPMREKHLWVRVFEATVGSFIGVGVEQGALNSLWAATSKEVVTGKYYVPVGKIAEGSADARDVNLAGMLWKWTEKQLESRKI